MRSPVSTRVTKSRNSGLIKVYWSEFGQVPKIRTYQSLKLNSRHQVEKFRTYHRTRVMNNLSYDKSGIFALKRTGAPGQGLTSARKPRSLPFWDPLARGPSPGVADLSKSERGKQIIQPRAESEQIAVWRLLY